ncbi:MAG: UDP-N-acetylglucosamine 2-epimerase (non-hydrolyzing) [Nitrospirae bacterium]|nr:UDP-N-acetylglucosamine 2-epimerase (non-hydrolyzing) [Candidatus Manganitrophaceae bacterium]
MIRLICVVGARPNFVKMAPLVQQIKEGWGDLFETTLVHTGQHYDQTLSKVFFDALRLPIPDVNLGVGSGSAARQIAEIMQRFEEVILWKKPDQVLVVGDVNSTLATALAAEKVGVPVAHVEAGLRSFDRRMPEEMNRILTDQLSELLFATEESAVQNLLNEGIGKERIFWVGNVMIDALISHAQEAERSTILRQLNLAPQGYALLTLHRPSNVDTQEGMHRIFALLSEVEKRIRVVFPVHPRTLGRMEEFDLMTSFRAMKNVTFCEPAGYLDFLRLMRDAKMVLTDSGGVQEETTALAIPCLTLRENTERPVTITQGTNLLTGTDPQRVLSAVIDIIEGRGKRGKVPALWDGQAALRIVQVLQGHAGQGRRHPTALPLSAPAPFN